MRKQSNEKAKTNKAIKKPSKPRKQRRTARRNQFEEWQTDEKLQLLKGWKRDGLTDEQIATAKIGVTPHTLSVWRSKYKSINKALKVGKEFSNFEVENALRNEALGGNVTAQIFYLKNNWRDKYSDSRQSKYADEADRQRARKLEAEADIVRARADLIVGASDGDERTIIVDDIGDIDNDDNNDE